MAYLKEEKDVVLEELVPVPHFVVKTKTFTPYRIYPSGTKFFINVCSSNKVPTKELKDEHGKEVIGFEPQLIFVSISNGEWEIPIITSPEIRETRDKKGIKSLLIDCVINDKYIKWCMLNEDLKDILIQWCIDAVEFQEGGSFVLDRDSISLPKRSCIGGEPLTIQVDFNHLKDVSKELEDLNKDIYMGKNDPLSLLKVKRLEDNLKEDDNIEANAEGTELPSLIPENISTKKKNLIVEVDESTAKEGVKQAQSSKKPQEEKIRFEVEMSKLPDNTTKLNHKYELKISSQIKNSKGYGLKYDDENKELIIFNSGDEVSKSNLNFPLPLDVTGEDITSFFVKKDGKLHVFIK